MRVLTLNAGSRSHNVRLYDVPDDALGGAGAISALEPPAPLWQDENEASDRGFASLLAAYDGPPPDLAAHRIVHGGEALATTLAARIDATVRAQIEAAIPLAPSHVPLALEGVDAVVARFGEGVDNVAVFDTLLGVDAPPFATTCAVPAAWRERYGVRRYGFHGISQRDVLDRLEMLYGRDDGRRTISVHLGSGCSISAFEGRRAIETTMGLTPSEGLVMGTRSGSIDPGVIFTLLRAGMSPDDLERALAKESGLLGLSGGRSSDTRDLTEARDRGDAAAGFALAYDAYRVRWHIGALAAATGGIDVLSFTGPVGEHVAEMRAAACAGLAFFGVAIDLARNAMARPDCDVAGSSSRVRIAVIRTLEEWAMARLAAALARGG